MVKQFLWSWGGNILGLFVASMLFSGIDYNNTLAVLLVASLIFGIINSLIRPVVIILSLPAIVFTMGIFTLVVNALMLGLTSRVYPAFQVKSLGSAIGAVVIIWLVNYCVDLVIYKEK